MVFCVPNNNYVSGGLGSTLALHVLVSHRPSPNHTTHGKLYDSLGSCSVQPSISVTWETRLSLCVRQSPFECALTLACVASSLFYNSRPCNVDLRLSFRALSLLNCFSSVHGRSVVVVFAVVAAVELVLVSVVVDRQSSVVSIALCRSSVVVGRRR